MFYLYSGWRPSGGEWAGTTARLGREMKHGVIDSDAGSF